LLPDFHSSFFPQGTTFTSIHPLFPHSCPALRQPSLYFPFIEGLPTPSSCFARTSSPVPCRLPSPLLPLSQNFPLNERHFSDPPFSCRVPTDLSLTHTPSAFFFGLDPLLSFLALEVPPSFHLSSRCVRFLGVVLCRFCPFSTHPLAFLPRPCVPTGIFLCLFPFPFLLLANLFYGRWLDHPYLTPWLPPFVWGFPFG